VCYRYLLYIELIVHKIIIYVWFIVLYYIYVYIYYIEVRILGKTKQLPLKKEIARSRKNNMAFCPIN
jgi:hypothetical protein